MRRIRMGNALHVNNNERQYTEPLAILFMVLPYGISTGFASVTLPFLLTQNGFTVAQASVVTALGLSANLLRFVWAPLTDLTLTLHKWFYLGLVISILTLLWLCLIPLNTGMHSTILIITFVSQVAATFVIAPVGGFMGKTVAADKKGRAGGMYQAGNLGGMGLGGGAGIWLSTHYSTIAAGLALSAVMMACVLVMFYAVPVSSEKGIGIKEKIKMLNIGIKDMVSTRISIFSVILIISPIGSGAAGYVWSSIGADWKVSSDTVALVTGTLSGFVSAAGCLLGGWAADKYGRWWAFFGSGAIMALVTLVMAISGYAPSVYTSGVLFYAFTMGMVNAAWTALILYVIGNHLASTKYALISSLGNLPPVYMTTFDGWLHDAHGTKSMLMGETLLGFGTIALSIFILSRIQYAQVKSIK